MKIVDVINSRLLLIFPEISENIKFAKITLTLAAVSASCLGVLFNTVLRIVPGF